MTAQIAASRSRWVAPTDDYWAGQQMVESDVNSGMIGGYQYVYSPRYIDTPFSGSRLEHQPHRRREQLALLLPGRRELQRHGSGKLQRHGRGALRLHALWCADGVQWNLGRGRQLALGDVQQHDPLRRPRVGLPDRSLLQPRPVLRSRTAEVRQPGPDGDCRKWFEPIRVLR